MEFHIVFECVYMGFSGDRGVYTSFLKESAYISRSMKVQGHTIDQELLGFAGIVYSFMYFSVGHFPRYRSPCKL
jgi:hypothetical protein